MVREKGGVASISFFRKELFVILWYHPRGGMDNMEDAQFEFQVYLTEQRFPFF